MRWRKTLLIKNANTQCNKFRWLHGFLATKIETKVARSDYSMFVIFLYIVLQSISLFTAVTKSPNF